MKTVKVYLKNDGSVLDWKQDFNINQYSFQDSLINVYVPTSIIDTQITTDETESDITTYSNNVMFGMTHIDRNGVEYVGNGYLFNFVKTGIIVDNVEYALFERLLPKEFSLYSGTQTLAINIVGVESIYDIEEETTTTNVTTTITSSTYDIYVNPSALFASESLEQDVAEALQAQITNAFTQLLDRQKKVDLSIVVKETHEGQTTTSNVVTALNKLNDRELETYGIATNALSIANANDQRLDDIEESVTLQEYYVGQVNSANAPSESGLNDYAESVSRDLQNGDIVIWVHQKVGTDEIYRCRYQSSTWSWYKIPSVESASNGTLGLVSGTYGIENYSTLVNIVGGEIRNIYVKKANEYVDLQNYLSLIELRLSGIESGLAPVGVANFAQYDTEEYSKPSINRKTFEQKYMQKGEGISRDTMVEYALPKMFNDIFINMVDQEYMINYDDFESAEIEQRQFNREMGSYSLQNVTISSPYLVQSKYSAEISSKNSYISKYVMSFDDVCSGNLVVNTYYVYQEDGEEKTILLTSDVRQVEIKSIDIDNLITFDFSSNFTNIIGEKPLVIEPMDLTQEDPVFDKTIKQEVIFQNTGETTVNITTYCDLDSNNVSTFGLNLNYATISFSEARKGEIDIVDLEVDLDYEGDGMRFILSQPLDNHTHYLLHLPKGEIVESAISNGTNVYFIDENGVSYNSSIGANAYDLLKAYNIYNNGTDVECFWNISVSYASGTKYIIFVPNKYGELTTSLGTKLDKITTSGNYRVYGVTNTGAQTTQDYGTGTTNWVLVQRNGTGQIKGVTPVANDDLANKGYVDGKLTKVTNSTTYRQVYMKSADGATQSMQSIDNYEATATNTPSGTLVQRDSAGRIAVATPTSANHAVNKSYVDSNISHLYEHNIGVVDDDGPDYQCHFRFFTNSATPITSVITIGQMIYARTGEYDINQYRVDKMFPASGFIFDGKGPVAGATAKSTGGFRIYYLSIESDGANYYYNYDFNTDIPQYIINDKVTQIF